MGDHADELLDDLFFLWGSDSGELDASRPNGYEKQSITCRGCGEAGLHWHDLNSDETHQRAPQWKLFDARNQRHVCKGNPEADKLAEGFLRRHARSKLPVY